MPDVLMIAAAHIVQGIAQVTGGARLDVIYRHDSQDIGAAVVLDRAKDGNLGRPDDIAFQPVSDRCVIRGVILETVPRIAKIAAQ